MFPTEVLNPIVRVRDRHKPSTALAWFSPVSASFATDFKMFVMMQSWEYLLVVLPIDYTSTNSGDRARLSQHSLPLCR
jgi:predicted small integral membrane protein